MDGLLIGGNRENTRNYMRELEQWFKVGKVSIGGTFRVISSDGCYVRDGRNVYVVSLGTHKED